MSLTSLTERFLSIWQYRYFIFSIIRSDFRIRLARSRLGLAWLVLQPLTQVTIYALILSSVLSAKLPGIDNKYSYAIYLMAGMLGWSLFSDIVTRCLTIFVENGNLMKKIVFPRICLPIIVSGIALVNNLFLFLAMMLVLGLLGHFPNLALLWLLPLILLTTALSIGLGLILGVLNVFIRDIGQIVPVVLPIWFWLTPIVYMLNIIPESLQDWLVFNPLYPLIVGYQNILVYGMMPPWSNLIWVMGFAIVLLGSALFLFRKAATEMVDVL